MSRSIYSFLVTCLVLYTAQASARDLPRSDPNRQDMLDAVRHRQSTLFIVKDMFRAGNFGYLCALPSDKKGHIQHTDDALDVYKWGFIHSHGQWLPVEIGGGLAGTTHSVDCQLEFQDGARLPASKADLAEQLTSTVREQVIDDLNAGHVPPISSPLLKAMKEHGLLADFSIEETRGKFDENALAVANKQCGKNAVCLARQRQSAATLRKLSTDPEVSSLLWNNCSRYARTFDLDNIAQCVNQNLKRPECRPGMAFVKDRQDIDKCLAELDTQCHRLFPSSDDQALVCSH